MSQSLWWPTGKDVAGNLDFIGDVSVAHDRARTMVNQSLINGSRLVDIAMDIYHEDETIELEMQGDAFHEALYDAILAIPPLLFKIWLANHSGLSGEEQRRLLAAFLAAQDERKTAA